ncbi:MAG TPA: hypothetical protein PLP26_05530, partial [Ilumatobacteraceae bacterium]|nr:hypothetical protein [Ilumatobacteraceae bacterium]
NDRPHTHGSDHADATLQASATTAAAAHRATVTDAETDAALAAVRHRIAAGDTGRPVELPQRRTTQRWRPWAAAAALMVIVAGGAIVLGQRHDDGKSIVPATDPSTSLVTNSTDVATTHITTATTTPATTTAPTTTTPTTTAPTTLALVQPIIPYRCASQYTCTQLTITDDGRIVAYEPTAEALVVYDGLGLAELQRVSLTDQFADAFPSLVGVGPDDVVYLTINTPGIIDPSRDLLAIPLSGPAAGTIVMRWTGLDGSGDSTLVPQKDSLVVVACCGYMETRPTADSTRFPYVDRSGAVTPDSRRTTFRMDLASGAGTLVRVDGGAETTFALPVEFQSPRDFPVLVATDDGGAIALDWIYLPDGDGMFIAHFLAATGDSQARVDVYKVDAVQIALLEPAHTVLVIDGDHFARRRIADIATQV